jgi:hypothetical protein
MLEPVGGTALPAGGQSCQRNRLDANGPDFAPSQITKLLSLLLAQTLDIQSNLLAAFPLYMVISNAS